MGHATVPLRLAITSVSITIDHSS